MKESRKRKKDGGKAINQTKTKVRVYVSDMIPAKFSLRGEVSMQKEIRRKNYVLSHWRQLERGKEGQAHMR